MIDSDTTGAQVLFVDDDPHLLDGIRRTLFDHFDVETAGGGAEALEIIGSDGPFEVIVSDMQMPSMDGAEFLTRARVLSPDSVRILLTGQADLNSAIAAVNDGNIYRFLCKPCPHDVLSRTLHDAAKQHRLVTAERELLEHTLKGAVEVLVDVLSIASPTAFSRASKLKACVAHLASCMNFQDPWRFEIAAMLSQLGSIALPTDLVDKSVAGLSLTETEQALVDGHPKTAFNMLVKIPRLKATAEMIRGVTEPAKMRPESDVEWGSEMVRTALALDQLLVGGATPEQAMATLHRTARHPSKLLDALGTYHATAPETIIKELTVQELQAGMLLKDAVRVEGGGVLVPAGRELTAALVARIQNFATSSGVTEPIRVELHATS